MAVDEHLAAQRGAEGHVLHNLALADGHKEQAAQVDGGEERADDADDEGGGEALDGTCAEEQQNHTGDDRGEVGVEDGREGVRVTFADCGARVLAGAEFFLGTLEDKHVGVDCHTQREHDTADTRQGEHSLERGKYAEGEEQVEDKAEVGDEAGDESVEGAHENHEQNQCDNKRHKAVVDGLLTQRRAYNHIGDDVYLGFHLTGLEYVGKVLAFLDGELAGDFGTAAFDDIVDVGGGVNLVVKYYGHSLALVGGSDACPVAGALGVHHHVYADTALERVLVHVRVGVGNHFAVKDSLAAGGAQSVEGISDFDFLAVLVGGDFGLHAPAQQQIVAQGGGGFGAFEDSVDFAHLLVVVGVTYNDVAGVDATAGEHGGEGGAVEGAVLT